MKEKKELRKVNYLFYILIFLLIFAVIFIVKAYFNTHYIYTGPSGEFNFDVIRVADIKVHLVHVFLTKAGKEYEYRLTFRNGPKKLEDINIEIADSVAETIVRDTIYLTQDPELPNLTNGKSTIAMIELGRIVGTAYYSIYKRPTISSVTRESEEGKGLGIPVIDCGNVTNKISVVKFRLGDKTRVYEKDGCVIVQGENGDELIRAADRLTLTLLGVMYKYY
jgi:hypothetical protein